MATSKLMKKTENFFTTLKQLGTSGKEGTTFLVKDKQGKEYAMKTFRKTKSPKTLEKEALLQIQASKKRVCPKVHSYDIKKKHIVMDKMDFHLTELIQRQKNSLTKIQQERILEIYQKLDEAKVFHNDSNINNYMVRRGRIYIIDFGFSKEITAALCKNLKTERPNYILMTIGFIMEAKRFFKNCPKIYDHILKSVSKENAKKYGLL